MTWSALALVAVCALIVGGSLGLLAGRRSERSERRQRTKAAVVRLRSGRRFRGALVDDSASMLVLARAELLQDGGQPPVALDGEVRVPHSGVEYVQVMRADRDMTAVVREPMNGERRAV